MELTQWQQIAITIIAFGGAFAVLRGLVTVIYRLARFIEELHKQVAMGDDHETLAQSVKELRQQVRMSNGRTMAQTIEDIHSRLKRGDKQFSEITLWQRNHEDTHRKRAAQAQTDIWQLGETLTLADTTSVGVQAKEETGNLLAEAGTSACRFSAVLVGV